MNLKQTTTTSLIQMTKLMIFKISVTLTGNVQQISQPSLIEMELCTLFKVRLSHKIFYKVKLVIAISFHHWQLLQRSQRELRNSSFPRIQTNMVFMLLICSRMELRWLSSSMIRFHALAKIHLELHLPNPMELNSGLFFLRKCGLNFMAITIELPADSSTKLSEICAVPQATFSEELMMILSRRFLSMMSKTSWWVAACLIPMIRNLLSNKVL